MFVDEATIRVQSGAGGNGCVSFRREKFVPRGGPDGGDGGRGGSIFLRANRQLATLVDLERRKHYAAPSGRPGMGGGRDGRRGRDLVIDVPPGTVVRQVLPGAEPREGPILGELLEHGARLCVARGGRGGRGNRAFATATNQTPRAAEEGEAGAEKELHLELKLIADVGLVGLPNAGKSTLLSRISRARPKIASYPFTTLAPHLGIAEVGDYDRLVVADIPGLIAGAAAGYGLGAAFLRHVERTRLLVHLVSVEEARLEGLLENYRIVEAELSSYSETLATKPRIVALSKVDLLLPADRALLQEALARRLERPVHVLSAVAGIGLAELLREAYRLVREA